MDYRNCIVCGDRAVGYNFSALTCESCRSFFRRNASRAQEFKCIFGDKCLIDCVSRKSCKKCRLNKCFANGMKRQSVLSGDNKIVRKSRKMCLSSKEVIDWTTDDSDCTQIIETYRTECTGQTAGHQAIDIPTLIRNVIFEFNELEMSRFKELFSATSAMREPLARITSETTLFEDVFKVLQRRCDIKCRRIVKMSTGLSQFTNLDENDKIVLLKESCPPIICLISIINFNFDGEYWTVVTNDVEATTLKLDIFKYVQGGLYEAHRKFLLNLQEEFNSDINILDLLTAILLFNPNQQNILHKNMVKCEQQMYIYLLQRYLELKYRSKSQSESRFVGLMNSIQELYALNRLHVYKFKENKPQLAGPLIEEIYEL